MKLNLYSIYDSVACVFNKPYTDINDASAIRSFSMSADKQPHIRDYSLMKLGELDDVSGEIIPCDVPVKVITGFEVVKNTDEKPEDS